MQCQSDTSDEGILLFTFQLYSDITNSYVGAIRDLQEVFRSQNLLVVPCTQNAKELVEVWLKSEYTPGGPSDPKVKRIYAIEEARLKEKGNS